MDGNRGTQEEELEEYKFPNQEQEGKAVPGDPTGHVSVNCTLLEENTCMWCSGAVKLGPLEL